MIVGVVKSCNPLCVRIGDRELGPLTSLVATSALTAGKSVILARLEDDPATLVVVGVIDGVPTASAGGGGSTTTTFPFNAPAATWTVNHGYGRRPVAQVLDAVGAQIDADVAYPDLNTVVVTHAQPTTGSVLVIA